MESAFEKDKKMWKPAENLIAAELYHNGRYWIIEDPYGFAIKCRDAALEEAAKIAEHEYQSPAWHSYYHSAGTSIAYLIRELKEQK